MSHEILGEKYHLLSSRNSVSWISAVMFSCLLSEHRKDKQIIFFSFQWVGFFRNTRPLHASLFINLDSNVCFDLKLHNSYENSRLSPTLSTLKSGEENEMVLGIAHTQLSNTQFSISESYLYNKQF